MPFYAINYVNLVVVSTLMTIRDRWRGRLAAAPAASGRRGWGDRGRSDRGQATAEYALLLLGVAAIALLVAAWAANSGQVGALLDRVFETISARVG